MSTRSFKSVGWVAGIGAAALGCYMLSLQVASERGELAGVERRIVATQQAIRSLQTELGTRGRLQQLEQWNTEVLALSAPVSGQFLDNEVTLARLERRSDDSLGNGVQVRMASAESGAAATPSEAQPQVRNAVVSPAAPQVRPAAPMVHQASLTRANAAAPAARPAPAPAPAASKTPAPPRTATPVRPAAPRATAPVRTAALLDERTSRAIGETARVERTAPRASRPATSRPETTASTRAAATVRPARTPAKD